MNAAASGYTLSEPPYNSSFAGYKDWFIQEFRRPGYTVEVGEGTSPLPLEQFPDICGMFTTDGHRNLLMSNFELIRSKFYLIFAKICIYFIGGT